MSAISYRTLENLAALMRANGWRQQGRLLTAVSTKYKGRRWALMTSLEYQRTRRTQGVALVRLAVETLSGTQLRCEDTLVVHEHDTVESLYEVMYILYEFLIDTACTQTVSDSLT